MLYLVTDENNKTIQHQWGENITHEESNPNYLFNTYDDPHLAHFLFPAYDTFIQPKLWECHGEQEVNATDIRLKFRKLTTLKEIDIPLPTKQQRINFAILIGLNLVLNQDFKNWAVNYLNETDQSKEAAYALSEKINYQSLRSDDYLNCVHPILGAILLDDETFFSAMTAHRAWFDSLEMPQQINLKQLAQISMFINGKMIAEYFGN
jgi:hypothetical protein